MLNWPLLSRKKGGFPGASVKNQPAMEGPLLIGICVFVPPPQLFGITNECYYYYP